MKKIVLMCALAITQLTLAQNVTTIAGSGSIGHYNANGVLALFNGPHDIAVNAAGEIFVADQVNHRIRKIDVNGDVTDFAGGTIGFADGTGAAAQFNNPSGLCINSTGDLFVADYSNHRIRKITPAGVVTTVAGNGTVGGNDANGTNASFNGPVGICINSMGVLYVAEQAGHRVRVILNNGDVFTVAGNGMPGYADGQGPMATFSSPYDIEVDNANNLYVVDQLNYRIRKISPTGEVTTFAGDGAQAVVEGNGTNASFYTPWGITYDPASGNLYVVSAGDVIQQITPSAEVTTFAGFANSGQFADGTLSSARFKDPTGIAMGINGDIIVADYYNHRVRRVGGTASLHEDATQLVTVFPNPAADIITISTESEIHKVHLFNTMGQLIQTEDTPTFSVSALNRGIYLLSISTDKGIVQCKFVKE